MRIEEESIKPDTFGLRAGKRWITMITLLGSFSITIFVLTMVSTPLSNSDLTSGISTEPGEVAYIKRGFTTADQWDSDAEVDGLKVKLKIYDKNDIIIREEGTLEAVLYEKLFDSNDNPLKGNELDRWTVKITKEDYVDDELNKKLEYHKPIPADFGWVEFTFIAKDGSRYQTYDDIVYLKI